ncbi:hypothetical protein Pelo_17769 [Pelomyxa schiedti]|nr:hypothetical protein Pelo_17769 [Pelomyxa schiedti]
MHTNTDAAEGAAVAVGDGDRAPLLSSEEEVTDDDVAEGPAPGSVSARRVGAEIVEPAAVALPEPPRDEPAGVPSTGAGAGGGGPLPVIVHVYDLAVELNNKYYSWGLGLYHSGVEVNGKEYWFQGHPFPYTGVVCIDHTTALMCMPLRESITVGYLPNTPRTIAHIKVVLDALTLSFRGNSYHPIHRNCNSFSEQFVSSVFEEVGCGCMGPRSLMPSYINRAAYMGSMVLKIIPEKVLWNGLAAVVGAGGGTTTTTDSTSTENEDLMQNAAEVSAMSSGTGFAIPETNLPSPCDPNETPLAQRDFATNTFMQYFGLT